MTGRYYQLLSGHASIGFYLARIGRTPTNECWLCGSCERLSRYHLSSGAKPGRTRARRCEGWSGGRGWKHPRAPFVRLLFQNERATPAALTFLREIKVGRVVTLAPSGVDWGEEMEVIELFP